MLRYTHPPHTQNGVNGLIYETRYYKIKKCTSELIRNILVLKLSVKPFVKYFGKENLIWRLVNICDSEISSDLLLFISPITYEFVFLCLYLVDTGRTFRMAESSNVNQARVILWGVPRCLSTSFLKCMTNVEDSICWHEPYLYANTDFTSVYISEVKVKLRCKNMCDESDKKWEGSHF